MPNTNGSKKVKLWQRSRFLRMEMASILFEIGEKSIGVKILNEGYPKHIHAGMGAYKWAKENFDKFCPVTENAFLKENQILVFWTDEYSLNSLSKIFGQCLDSSFNTSETINSRFLRWGYSLQG